MHTEDIDQNKVGEEATIIGEVRESVKGVFYDKIGYWLNVKDSTGDAWVFSERDFNSKTRVKAEGLIEMNYDQASLIAQKIDEYAKEEPTQSDEAAAGAVEETKEKRGGKSKTIIIALVAAIIIAALVIKLKPDLLSGIKTKLSGIKISVKK